MIKTFRTAFFKHASLVIAAAWLYTISFIISNYWTYQSSPEKVTSRIEKRIHDLSFQFLNLISDSVKVKDLLDNNPQSLILKNELVEKEYALFIYSVDDSLNYQLLYWNTNQSYIENVDKLTNDTCVFVNYQNGDFVILNKIVTLNTKKYQAFCVIPVYQKFFTQTKHLHNHFSGFEKLEERYEIDYTVSGIPVKDINKNFLFSIIEKKGHITAPYDWITLLVRSVSILLFLFFLNSVAFELIDKIGFYQSFLFLLSAVLSLRLLAYYTPLFFDWNRVPLFDPSIYASTIINPSLGDLFINTVLVYWLIDFFRFYNHSVKVSSIYREIFTTTFLTVFLFFLTSLIRSLVTDSKISFRVTSFFSLNIYTVLSFIILCLLILIYFQFAILVLKHSGKEIHFLFVRILTATLVGFGIISFNVYSTIAIVNIFCVGWLLIFLILLNYRQQTIKQGLFKSTFFIFWIMFFAASVSALILFQNKIIQEEQNKKEAEKLLLKTDTNGETLLNIATTNLSDYFIASNFSRFESEFSSKYIKDSLINENFTGYLNKYETRIYTFDSLYHSLHNEDSLSFAEIRTTIINQSNPTDILGLFIYEDNSGKYNYIFEKKVIQNNQFLGYFYISIKPKKYKSDALFPELFAQTQDAYNDLNTSYALYYNSKLVYNFNNYDFSSTLNKNQIPSYVFEQRKKEGYNELWYNAGNGKVIVIAQKDNTLIEWLTLFAYIFLSVLIIVAFYAVIQFLISVRFRISGIRNLLVLDIRSQIHAIIISITVFSFVIIGIATISFFIMRFNKNNTDKLTASIQTIASEVDMKLKNNFVFDDVVNIYNLSASNRLEFLLNEISEIHNLDINLYSHKGTLLQSTQPYIFNKHLLSIKMHPLAYIALNDQVKSRVVQYESVGSFSFLSMYVPLRDDNNQIYAYLNIPYLNSQAELKQEISGFLATLINLNALIFLIAGAIAFLITNRITASFAIIGNQMKKINLGTVNEQIEWKGKDEIGVLVAEYNKMVTKLNESAAALAKSEREGAWREMAKQVAHEIKNPLTPMKLSLQYLQRAIDTNDPNINELTVQVSKTLVEQIDQLTVIASDFSQFANIGNVHPEYFDISAVIESVVNLHSANKAIQFTWQKTNEKQLVFADKIQITRLFNNLIKNAIEATEKSSIITIAQSIQANKAIISIADNGSGIPSQIIPKIFTPNFTTKSSGAGLGLAICKGIVENANGSIWFETNKHTGTIFYIELPLANNDAFNTPE